MGTPTSTMYAITKFRFFLDKTPPVFTAEQNCGPRWDLVLARITMAIHGAFLRRLATKKARRYGKRRATLPLVASD